MAKSPTPQPVPPLPDWFLPVVSLGCLILFVLHTAGRVKLDTIGLLLIAACAVVWLLPQVSKIKLGDLELELKLAALIEAQSEPDGPPPPFSAKDWLFGGRKVRDDDGTIDLLGQRGHSQRPDLLTALAQSPFAFRSETGLTRDTGLDPDDLRDMLAAMEVRGLVLQLSGADGRRLWTLTAEGKARL